MKNTPYQDLGQGVGYNNVAQVKKALSSGFVFGDYQSSGHQRRTWLGEAARDCSAELVAAMLDYGFDINAMDMPEKSPALDSAIGSDNLEVVELLIRRGTDLGLSRPLIAALNEEIPPERRLHYVKLLVENGVDVNKLYDLYGDPNVVFTALDWTDDPDIIAYLQSHGAKSSKELKGETIDPNASTLHASSPSEEVVQYFSENYGQVEQKSLIEILPTDNPIAINIIKPDRDRKHLTLFTTGLSDKPMTTPAGQEEFQLAELFIQVPGNWLSGSKCPSENQWVIDWLLQIAQYPHENETWLGGPLTIIDNEDPPKPLTPTVRFTSWLLLAEKSFRRRDGKTVQLYRLTPIYRDERDIERRDGAPALMRAFDRANVPFILDLNRRSVAG